MYIHNNYICPDRLRTGKWMDTALVWMTVTMQESLHAQDPNKEMSKQRKQLTSVETRQNVVL